MLLITSMNTIPESPAERMFEAVTGAHPEMESAGVTSLVSECFI
jgi:hypothetical protein